MKCHTTCNKEEKQIKLHHKRKNLVLYNFIYVLYKNANDVSIILQLQKCGLIQIIATFFFQYIFGGRISRKIENKYNSKNSNFHVR